MCVCVCVHARLCVFVCVCVGVCINVHIHKILLDLLISSVCRRSLPQITRIDMITISREFTASVEGPTQILLVMYVRMCMHV